MSTLFSIETDQVRIVWSRRRARPVPVEPAAQPFGLEVRSAREGEPVQTQVAAGWATHLFEQTDYTLFVQSLRGAAVRVRHRDPVLLAGLHHSDEDRVVHGVVNFGTQVGRSRFGVEVEGALHVTFEVEVFPSKLDYRRDYRALLADVQDVAKALVLEYLRPAVQPGHAVPAAGERALVWTTLLRQVLDDLEQALHQVLRHPLWGTDPVRQEQAVERVRRPDAAVRRAVARGEGSGAWLRLQNGRPVRARLPEHRARYTLDTPEHRWLAAQLRDFYGGLGRAREEEARRPPGARRAQVLQELEGLQQRLGRLLQALPGAGAEEGAPPAPTLRLMTAPGYREAYRACRLLRQGVFVGGGPLELTLKDLHLLYEYWCFLTLVRLAAEQAGAPLPARALLALEERGLRLRLRRGRAQTVRFRLPDGRRLTLTYNPLFAGRGYLVPQRPDIVLAVYAPDGSSAHYILDAKYRLDASPAYRQRYGTPGPPVEALNDLHRYRGALLGRGRRTVAQAVALFPYREEAPGAFAESRHGRALREGGVGALPLLPGSTAYLEAWLRSVIA